MGFVDYMVIAVIVLILGGAGFYIWRAKKRGKTCIGCPDSSGCSGSCGSCNCDCRCNHNK